MIVTEMRIPWNDKSKENVFPLVLPDDARVLAVYRRETDFYILYAYNNAVATRERKIVALVADDVVPIRWEVDPVKWSVDYLGGDYVWYALSNDSKTVHFFEVKEKKHG
jgi:hypothetical protein